jgi:hypothetical protein
MQRTTGAAAVIAVARLAGRPTAPSGCVMAAFAIAMCGGIVVLYVFFVAIGTVDLGDALATTVGVVVLALIWLAAYAYRQKTNALVAQRPDRERRGF